MRDKTPDNLPSLDLVGTAFGFSPAESLLLNAAMAAAAPPAAGERVGSPTPNPLGHAPGTLGAP
ncbi:MAG: hypothetical protein ACTHJQ_18560, partial [Rhizobiaceae bacterium]